MEVKANMEKKDERMHRLLKRVVEQLSLLVPGRKIHFIYTHNLSEDRFAYGLKANTEISYWSLKALRDAFPNVFFLRIEGEKPSRIRAIKAQDIVIGHIGETFLKASERTKKLIAFYPWAGHEDRSVNTLFNCFPLANEKIFWEKASSIILLSSEYNLREYLQKERNFWFPYYQEIRSQKPIRIVHQPIDFTQFARIKTSYATSNFLYVGNDAHMKCVEDSKKLVGAVGRTLHLYGVGKFRLNNLDKRQVASLASQADFFIQPGMWGGQCMAILEAAARGFIPLVSPETGYPYEHPYLLRCGNFSYNLSILKKVLLLPSIERKAIADVLHSKLQQDRNHNAWDHLGKVLVEEVKKLK